MSKTRPFKKLVWAFDPFEANGETQRNVSRVLEVFTRGVPSEIHPVYVMNPTDLGVPMSLSALGLKQYLPSVNRVMKNALQGVSLRNLTPPEIAVQRNPSLRNSVKTFLLQAKEDRADLLVVGTHSRKGLSRFLLGSFTESLLLQSKIPVLVVNASAEAKPIRNILFPSDFSRESKHAFKKTISLARSLGAKITLLHVIPHPIEPLVQTGVYLLGGGWVSIPDFIRRTEQERRAQATSWVELARRAKVEVSVLFESGKTSVREAILEQADSSKAGLIALAAESGTVSTALLGSISRQVVRDAHCPVWVMRP